MVKFDHLFIQPRDWEKSFKFYTEVLGWEITKQFGKAQDASRFAQFTYGDGFSLILAEDHDMSDPEKKPNVYLTNGKISIHFNSENVDETFERIGAGSHVLIKPENTHWGTRWFVIEDPDGNQFAWQSSNQV